MSNLAVRAFARELVKNLIPEAPFQKTIAILATPKNLPDLWCTLEFPDAGLQRLTVGETAIWREYGSFSLVLLAKSGYGEDALVELGSKLTRYARDLQTRLTEASGIVGSLRIDNVSPPNPEPYEDGNWATCSVVCVYTYDSVRGRGE